MSADESREFDWLEDDGDVVVRAQSAIAIYPGPSGVVIRRQGDLWSGDGDDVIWFDPQHAPAVAMAILEAVGLDAAVLTPEPARSSSKRKGASGAERQKKEQPSEPDLLERNDVTRDSAS